MSVERCGSSPLTRQRPIISMTLARRSGATLAVAPSSAWLSLKARVCSTCAAGPAPPPSSSPPRAVRATPAPPEESRGANYQTPKARDDSAGTPEAKCAERERRVVEGSHREDSGKRTAGEEATAANQRARKAVAATSATRSTTEAT